jgi:uncharacterized membrane protein
VFALLATSCLLRSGRGDVVPSPLAFSIAVAGLLLGAVTGWLGGELVDRLGVGVDDGAHLNAPHSLTGRPAHEGPLNRPVRG